MYLIPEVDLFIKYSEYNNIWEQIESVIGKVDEDEIHYSSGAKAYVKS